MTIIGSIEALVKGNAVGFVGYPRQYTNDSIIGVDAAGEPFTLTLSIPERFIEAAKKQSDIRVPEISALSETHSRARNLCFATETNGPITRSGGCFLAEQVEVVDAAKRIYSAKWMSILKDWDDAMEPQIGVGYLEPNVKIPFTPEGEAKKIKLMSMNADLAAAKSVSKDVEQINGIDLVDFVSARDELALDIYRMSAKWFVGVDVQYRRLETADLSNEAHVRRLVLELIESNSVNGKYGGVIMRPVKTDGQSRIVQLDGVRRLNHSYDYQNRLVPEVSPVWDNFIGKGSGWLKYMKREGFEIEIIPIQRINGKQSNEKFSKEYAAGIPKHIKAFVDKEFHQAPYQSFASAGAMLVSPIAIRLADTRKSEFKGTSLLSNLHSFGKVIGNALELDKNAERTLKLSSQPMPKGVLPRDKQPEPALD